MAKEKQYLLTLKVDFETSAEFQAAASILGARSYATLLNQFVVSKIREAKQAVPEEEFEEKLEEKKAKILSRSKMKAIEHKKSVEKLTKENIPKVSADDLKKRKSKDSSKK